MATAQYSYHPFHTIGAATVLIWDPAAASGSGAWQRLGRVADAAINVTTEQVGKELVIKGLSQPIARRNRAKKYSLAFRLLEDANPETLDLLFADGAQQVNEDGGLKATSEVLRLYGEEYTELAHPYGIPQEPLAGVTGMHAAAGGSGGSIAPGTYYYWVAPAMEDPGKPALEGMTTIAGPVTVLAGQVVTITFTPPAGYVPDKYRVYYNTLSEIASAMLIGESTTGSPITIPIHVPVGNYEGVNPPYVALYSYSGQINFQHNSDYMLLEPRGLIKRLSTGSILSGQRLLAVYVYRRQAGIETQLGATVNLERYRTVKLLQLAPAGPDPASWSETGLEFVLHRVNVAMNDTELRFAEDEFSEGAPVTWDCLYDGEQGGVGTVRSSFAVLASY